MNHARKAQGRHPARFQAEQRCQVDRATTIRAIRSHAVLSALFQFVHSNDRSNAIAKISALFPVVASNERANAI